MAILEAAALVTSIKDASDLVGKALAANPREAGPITDLLINARMSVLDLVERNALLRDEIAGIKERLDAAERENRKLLDFSEQSEKYERVQRPRGTFVYKEKAPQGSNRPVPYLCPNCFTEKKESILQPWNISTQLFKCFACDKFFDL